MFLYKVVVRSSPLDAQSVSAFVETSKEVPFQHGRAWLNETWLSTYAVPAPCEARNFPHQNTGVIEAS